MQREFEVTNKVNLVWICSWTQVYFTNRQTESVVENSLCGRLGIEQSPDQCFGLSVDDAQHTNRLLDEPSYNPTSPGEVLPEQLGGDVRPSSQNPYPIYDQNLRYFLPYLWPDKNSKPYSWPEPYIKILFQTCVIVGSLVQTNVKIP